MSESGHSQPGMYGPGRRRRRRRGERDVGPPGQNLSGPSRDREYQQRERRVTKGFVYAWVGVLFCGAVNEWMNERKTDWRLTQVKVIKRIIIITSSEQDGSEDPPGPLIQKTPIILAKPPGDRVCNVCLMVCVFLFVTGHPELHTHAPLNDLNVTDKEK